MFLCLDSHLRLTGIVVVVASRIHRSRKPKQSHSLQSPTPSFRVATNNIFNRDQGALALLSLDAKQKE
jgi:hypothetical protein